MRFDAVVFDLDGTLTESAPGIMKSAAYALGEMRRAVPPEETLREFVGPPLADSFMRFCGLTQTEALEAVEIYRVRHKALGWKEATVYEGILPLLLSLRRAGAYVALASSKPLPLCEQTLEYFGLRGLFHKLSAPDYAAVKADKRELILNALPQRYTSACMVGDRRFDMEGARGANVRAIGAGYGYGSREELMNAGADDYCADVETLTSLLLGDSPRAPGCFISFEGPDGCGKSTQIRLLNDYLAQCGARVTLTREPGGCPISERIRSLVLDVKAMGMTDECEALLFAASRAQHVRDVIRPALSCGRVVLCDRYVDSSIAFQGGGRNLGEWVKKINEPAVAGCMPDLTLFLDIDPRTALSRRVRATRADRIEVEGDAFARRVYGAFEALAQAEPRRIARVDATGTIEQIQARVRQIVIRKLTRMACAPEDSEE